MGVFQQECVNFFREILRLANEMVLLGYLRSWVCCTPRFLSHSNAAYPSLTALDSSQLRNKCLVTRLHETMFASLVFKLPLETGYLNQ